MRFYGVVSDEVQEIVEFFARREDAETFIEECLDDEPQWASVLWVGSFDFDTSAN